VLLGFSFKINMVLDRWKQSPRKIYK